MESISRGLQEVMLPGRMQQLCRSPLVLVDVGHNPLAAKAVAQAIAEASNIRPGGECRCVFGMLKDKDAHEVVAILHPLVSAWYCAGLSGERGRSGLDLSSHVLAVEASAHVLVCNDVETAFAQALDDSSPNDCVLVFGSFLTAAAAIGHWKSNELVAS
jgi:dihydrofolate synthase/folylpolyglutamate synthase